MVRMMVDYGIDADHPLSLIMAVLDNGIQGQRVMDALTECGYVVVRTSKIKTLEGDAKWLRCLKAAGVDNWQGIEVAQEMCFPID